MIRPQGSWTHRPRFKLGQALRRACGLIKGGITRTHKSKPTSRRRHPRPTPSKRRSAHRLKMFRPMTTFRWNPRFKLTQSRLLSTIPFPSRRRNRSNKRQKSPHQSQSGSATRLRDLIRLGLWRFQFLLANRLGPRAWDRASLTRRARQSLMLLLHYDVRTRQGLLTCRYPRAIPLALRI